MKGEAEYNTAQVKAYAEGAADRMIGKKDAVLGALTGDRSLQDQGMLQWILPYNIVDHLTGYTGNLRHDKGQAQQDSNRFA
jgi:hypothetical protein